MEPMQWEAKAILPPKLPETITRKNSCWRLPTHGTSFSQRSAPLRTLSRIFSLDPPTPPCGTWHTTAASSSNTYFLTETMVAER